MELNFLKFNFDSRVTTSKYRVHYNSLREDIHELTFYGLKRKSYGLGDCTRTEPSR